MDSTSLESISKYYSDLSHDVHLLNDAKARYHESERIKTEFFKSVMKFLGIENHPKAEKLMSIAWENVHSNVYQAVALEVYQAVALEAQKLMELIL